MFRLTAKETAQLNRSQIVTGCQKHRDPRFPPFAFTEQGVAMFSSVLHSERAVLVNIEIMRAFVRLRHLLAVNADEREKRVGTHDDQFLQVVQAIRQLMEPPPPASKGRFGFHMPEKLSATEAKPGSEPLPAESRVPSRRRQARDKNAEDA